MMVVLVVLVVLVVCVWGGGREARRCNTGCSATEMAATRRRRTCRRRSAPSGWPPAAASHAPCRSVGALAASPRARPPSGAPSKRPLYPRRRGPPVRERGTESASRGSGREPRQKRVRRTQVAVQGTVQTLGSAPALRAAGSANARLAAAQTSVGVLTRAEMSVAA